MAGFFSPGLGFASGIGAFIGGAAKQANENIEEERKQARQDDILWLNRFERGLAEYEKEKKDASLNSSAYNSLLEATGGNKKAADIYMQQVLRDPKSFKDVLTSAINNKQNYLPDSPDYQSNMLDTIQSGVSNKRSNLQNMYDTARPQAKKFMVMPGDSSNGGQSYGGGSSGGQQNFVGGAGPQTPSQVPQARSDTSTNYSQGPNAQPDPLVNENNNPTLNDQINQAPNSGEISLDKPAIQPVANQGAAPTGAQPYSNAPTGKPVVPGHMFDKPPATSEINKIIYDIDKFNTKEGFIRYNRSVTQNPQNPERWDISDLRNPSPAQPKLDPLVQQSVAEVLKTHGPYMEPKDRADFINSVREANQTGDMSKIRWELAPTQDQIDKRKAETAGAVATAQGFAKGLEKKEGELSHIGMLATDADNLIRMATSGTPLKAGYFQPFLDNVNRIFQGAGADLTKLGLPANNVNDVNELKKVISNMTFQTISQYHLGRWTNYEVGLLKEQLPGLDTDPNTLVKIALLIKNAAQRELFMHRKESELAIGPNGENWDKPNIGAAKSFASKFLSDEDGRVPWLRIDSRWSNEVNRSIVNDAVQSGKLKSGGWVEDTSTGKLQQYRSQ